MRRPVGVAVADDGSYVVVCDDGTVWRYGVHGDPGKRWERVEPPIPGSPENPSPEGAPARVSGKAYSGKGFPGTPTRS